MPEVETIRVQSWAELMEALYADSWREDLGRFRSRYAYRGMASAAYGLKTSLMRLGDRHGLATVGYTRQREFLTNLGFSSFLDALEKEGLSAARTELHRMALMALVDPEQYGDFKVLAQAKGIALGEALLGFRGDP